MIRSAAFVAAILALVLALIALSGCDMTTVKVDRKLQVKLFSDCLAQVPKGPERTVYNDWAEVIAECRGASHDMALVSVPIISRKASE